MTITTQNIELQNTAYYCQWGSTMCLAKFFKLVKVGTKFYGISIPAKEYHISAKKIKTNNTSLIVEKFAYAPEFSRPQFVKRMKTEKDIFGILRIGTLSTR